MHAPDTGDSSRRQTHQSVPVPGMAQARNNAGGFAFAVDIWTRLDRFLILGTEGGSYYASDQQLFNQNAEVVRLCLESDGPRTVARIIAISEDGRALKNDPAVYALAIAAGAENRVTRELALGALPRVCRTGTHLFQFAEGIETSRGWGRALRRAVGEWYTTKSPSDLAYQLCKYQRRGGWSHQDLLRMCHVKAMGPSNSALRWAVGKGIEANSMDASSPLASIAGTEAAKRASRSEEVIHLIRAYGLPRECVPTRWLAEAGVWEALLVRMPMTALVRNLATLTRVGLLTP
ncbi:TROVE domain-containing protein, partial [Singulisphaera rosea]